MFRVAIVGCGHIAESHASTLRSIPTVDIVGACDRDIDQVREFAGRHGLPVARGSLAALLDESRPDIVHILTPPVSHRELALNVLDSGASALIEKPFAETQTDAEIMVQAEGVARGTLSVCHNYLYLPVMRAALRLIEQGAVGRIISAEVYWRISSLDATRSDAQRWVEKLPGGAFQEVGPHVVYLLRAVLGDLQCVAATRAGDDELRAQFRAGERLGALTIATGTEPVQKFLRIHGTRMTLQVDLGSNVLLRLRPRGGAIMGRALLNLETAGQLLGGTAANVFRTLAGRMPRSHPAFIRAYYDRLGRGLSPPATASDGLAVTRILDQVWDALHDGA